MVSRYAQWQPSVAPRRHVVCVWVRENGGGDAHGQLVVPDGCVDLMWCDGALEVVGPDRGARTVPVRAGAGIAGVRLRPGAAGLLLGRLPAREVCDLQVPLAEVLPRDRVRRLADRLAGAEGPRAAGVLDAFAASLPTDHAPDPVVEHAVAVLGRPAPVRLSSLAGHVGLSERQLRRRVTDAVGYGPKTLHAVLRFQRALARARAGGAGLAEVALRAGYADQAHFTREVRRLAGVPPTVLLGAGRTAQGVRS
ncbi:helix-turn-helix domain-containing protein [Streptantibioticus cattleyicolor]|uniref:Transcriptional regulator, AraC family n=1 Tax=Streptantibioticus cattleyicolor (strain ATCC 35852 / DSM 46488 / JCM 4925 / NBRC 14057 / NRRL 8057) TaxID=1003195 RepID=F8JKE3_STREN|nr:helix-turn-helix domain-containing protein [Streptantibioticus cattleyicolor]AEW98493.1 transcriptional regulator, AraC family [Streptantibioticus cattleyicolor NRRL 8057 = DSM 46488]CCB72450.1 AraC family transcriptional regulator [Streptantibioticus cattleyicolor NRRL 8057 = DSM 46488]